MEWAHDCSLWSYSTFRVFEISYNKMVPNRAGEMALLGECRAV